MKTKLLLAMAVMLSLGGCASNNTEQEVQVPLEIRSNPQLAIIYSDEMAARALVPMSINVDNSQKLPRAVVRMKNRATIDVPMEYQVQWEDAYGAPIQTKAAWQRMVMPANAEKTIVNLGKSEDAKTATIHIRLATDVEIWVPYPDPVELIRQ